MGIAYQRSLESLQRLSLIGGGASPRYLSQAELSTAVGRDGTSVHFPETEYELIDYTPLALVDENHGRHRGSIVCRLPLHVVAPKLSLPEIRDLGKIHDNLIITARHVRADADRILREHECSDTCEISYAVLKPRAHQGMSTAALVDVESDTFAQSVHILPFDELKGYLGVEDVSQDPVGYKVKHVRRLEHAEAADDVCVVKNIPLSIISRFMTIQGIRSLGSYHNIKIPVRWTKDKGIEALRTHICNNCNALFFCLTPVGTTKRRRAPKAGDWVEEDLSPIIWDAHVDIPSDHYPPRPTTMVDIARVMSRYCDDLSPRVIEESGCCICAQLTKRVDLIPFEEGAYDLALLEEIGCTRLERTSAADPVVDIKGPVIEPTLSDICPSCHSALSRGHRPKEALANHFWVGAVPDCLTGLTLGESALISRVRFNRCVVRVAKGHFKMVANVIAFEHPSKKIYHRLPMGREELSEVLAVTFTGVEPPGDDDLKRTPVLVRRDKVRAALEWLKLNHKDYADLGIDYEALGTYPLNDVPFGLLKQTTIADGGNTLAAAKSVFDTNDE
ncbi:hypothetical protein DFP72DRAFT_825682, partial [Ephemerocybe angulata]